jgi:hypothetical protein
VDVEQVVVVVDLAGSVLGDAEPQIVGVHAAAVIGHLDQAAPAVEDADRDLPGAGVEGVLDQLLDDAGRALDALAGRNAADHGRRQEADLTHRAKYNGRPDAAQNHEHEVRSEQRGSTTSHTCLNPPR